MRSLVSLLALLLFAGPLACSKPNEPASNQPSADEDGSRDEPAATPACGGFAGTACPDGLTCVDDPADDCDPDQGGADCMGICVADQPDESQCDFTADPAKHYVGHSPEQCALIKFGCEDGQEYFADDCGCGCLDVDGE